MHSQTLLVTGCAGFIGFHLCQRLLAEGHRVVGVDILNDYYDVQLKRDRLQQLNNVGLEFFQLDLANQHQTARLFEANRFECVIHLAAQAGVRYSKSNPHAYSSSNLEAFLNVLEGCRHQQCPHLLYASSSSVYGANQKLPFSTRDRADRPVSLYGATKRANELMAHSYSWMYQLPVTGLRFFTVYGPWGRPDMALYIFAQKILEDQPIQLFNHGQMKRDFTYVDDVVESLVRLLNRPPAATPNQAPAQLFNVGNNNPAELRYFVQLIETSLGKKAQIQLEPLQTGDVVETYADTSDLEDYVGYRPNTALEEGIHKTITWYLSYRRQRGLESPQFH